MYDIVTFGEAMVRLSPPHCQRLEQARSLDLHVGGAELNVTRFPYEIARLAQEVAGGIMVTMPLERDFEDPIIGKYVAKYLKGGEGVPVTSYPNTAAY